MTERGMVVGARRAGLSISETADLLGFSRTTSGGKSTEKQSSSKVPLSSKKRSASRVKVLVQKTT